MGVRPHRTLITILVLVKVHRHAHFLAEDRAQGAVHVRRRQALPYQLLHT